VTRPWTIHWFWFLLAIANMCIGVVLATHPDRATDFNTVRQWTREWLLAGRDLYALHQGTDYPPHAIVVLSPIGLLPERAAAALWATLNLILAIGTPFLAVRFVRPRAGRPEIVDMTLLFLCWSGTKTLLQFSLVTLTLGLAACVLAGRRPVVSGVFLGLSLMKPQMAAPFVLWSLFTRRWKVVGVSVGTIALGTGLFCLRAGVDPLDMAAAYARTLRLFYTGDRAMSGLTQVRPLFTPFARGAAADGLAAVVSVAFLSFICVAGVREAKNQERVRYAAPAMAAVWSLVTFYHLTYGFVVLLPTAAVLLLSEDPVMRRQRHVLFWILQAGLVVDVLLVWRRARPFIPRLEAAGWFVMNVDRLFILFIAAGMSAIWIAMPVKGRSGD
jgi:hypothetical protein